MSKGIETNQSKTLDEADYAKQLLIKVANENLDL